MSNDEGDLTHTNDNEDFDDDNAETDNDSIMNEKNDRLEIIVEEVDKDDDNNNSSVITETEKRVENIGIKLIENKEQVAQTVENEKPHTSTKNIRLCRSTAG